MRGLYSQPDSKFRADAFACLGLTSHPRKDVLFSIAYRHGRDQGIEKIFDLMEGMACLLK